VGSCWRSYELKSAFVANDRRLSGSSRPKACQVIMMPLFSIYEELTDIICVSDVGSSAIVDLNGRVLMASAGWTQARLLAI
jgi:hypothetical protein